MFKDFSIREKMLNDFGFGTEDQIGASRDLLYPFMWVNLVGTQYVDNLQCESYHFQISFLDKLTSGEDNYVETLSDAQYIYRQFIGEIKQHPYWDNMGLSLLTNQLSTTAVFMVDDSTVQGFEFDLWIKEPIRISYCNSPIEPITNYTTVFDTEQGNAYRIIGAQGPQGTTGPPGYNGINGVTGSQGPQGFQGNTGVSGLQGPQGTQGFLGGTGPQGPSGLTTLNDALVMTFDGGGGVIDSSAIGYFRVPYGFTISSWNVDATGVGSIQFDLKNNGSSIIGAGNKPKLIVAQNNSSIISGWSQSSFTASQLFQVSIDNVTSLSWASLIINITRGSL